MLSVDPADRYQRADEIQEELGHLLDPGFVGDRELVRLLGRIYDVERERGILAAEVARAQRELAESEAAPEVQAATPAGSSPPAPPRERSQTPAGGKRGRVAIGAVLVVAACVLLYRGVKQAPDDAAPSGGGPQAAAPKPPTVAPPEPAVAEVPRVTPPAGVKKEHQSAPPPPTKQVSARTPVTERHEKPQPRPIASPPPAAPEEAPDPSAILQRAQRSFDLGNLAEAITLAREAARAGGGSRAHLMAGKALLADGRATEAETELAEAVRLAPADRDARQFLERLRARRQRTE
jgi:tetratricopeptide (TPR) repeat protein